MSFLDVILQLIRAVKGASDDAAPVAPPVSSPTPERSPQTPQRVPPDRPGTFIIPDIYPQDLGPHPHFEGLPGNVVMGKEVVGCYIKCSEGTGWSGESWFLQNWPRLRALTNDSFFAGVYHFLRFTADGAAQADYLCNLVERAGGLGEWALAVWVDVEEGGQGHWADDPKTHLPRKLEKITDPAERTRLANEIRTCTSAFISRMRQRMPGVQVGLYGRGVFRDLEIRDANYGQDLVCDPAYTATMPSMDAYGIPLSKIPEWQICGDGQVYRAGFPSLIPNWGRTDYTVVIDGANPTTLATVRRRCLARPR